MDLLDRLFWSHSLSQLIQHRNEGTLQQKTRTYLFYYLVSRIVLVSSDNEPTPFIYKPYLLNHLPPCSINYVPKITKEEDKKVEYKAKKRLIVVKDSFVRDEGELRLNTLLLMQYLVGLSECRC